MSTSSPVSNNTSSVVSRWRRWLLRLEGSEPADVETEYLRSLFRNYISNSPLAIFTTLFLYNAAPELPPGKAAYYWVICNVLFHALRTVAGIAYLRLIDLNERELRLWGFLSVFLQMVDGLLMVTLALVIYPLLDPLAQSALLMASLIIVGATASTFAWRWWSMAVYVPPTYFAFAWATWPLEHAYAKPVAILVLVFFILYLFHARNHRDFVAQAMDLAHRNGELARGNGAMARELKVKNDQLQEVATARSRLLATVSHDLRQPAHAIGLLCERALSEFNPQSLKDSLGDLNELSQSLSASLTTLMDLTRLDAGLVTVNKAPTPLSQVLLRLDAEFSASARNKGLEFLVPQSTHWVQSDPDLLHGVLANLVSNAIKYTRQGRVHVLLTESEELITVSVRDSGDGIAKDKLELIFKEFVRLDASESGTEGLGLGLSIVRRYASLLNHELTVDSEPKRGSCFSITLPQTTPDRQVTEVQANARSMAVKDQRLDGLRVLVVDNVDMLLSNMSKTLVTWGCDVHSARNITEALQVAEKHRLDMVISDFHLGDREPDGLALITAMRSLHAVQAATLPAILMTGDVSSQLEADAQRRKVRLLHKPVRPALLQNCMLNLLPQVEPPNRRAPESSV
jgi:signal transduction histidine kinase/CheY-like chemotaxis protein